MSHPSKRCCTLLNPSSDIVQHLNQQASLRKIIHTEDLVNAHDIEVPHVCQTSISVDLDALENSLKNLPSTFCLKVKVSETSLPEISSIRDAAELGCIYKTPDAISTAMISQYQITDKHAAVTVLDLDQPIIVTPSYLTQCADTLGATGKLIIFTVGNKNKKDIAEWEKQLILTSRPYLLLQCVEPEQILKILTQCSNHILTGCLWGWWGALLSESTHVISPLPWAAGEKTHTKISEWQYMPSAWPYSRFFDQIYYINLDRRTDRREHMEKQLARLNLSATRIPAVNGAEMTWKPEYGILSNFWNTGALAYCLSYRAAIVDAIKKDRDYVLIMDDDAVLSDNLYEVLEQAWKTLPEECHMLYLGANHGHPDPVSMPTEQDRIGDHLYKLSGSLGSHAIILNKVCFKNVLNFLASPYAPLDMFFSLYHKFFLCYITYPGLASQMPGHSDILNKEVNYTEDWNIDYINHIKGRTL
jgi:GR25 family glycosyltransferase involved in LPS biosynthesis